MEKKISKMLEDTIEKEIENLSSMSSGSKEKASAVEDLSKLYKIHLEEVKNEEECSEKSKRLEFEKKSHKDDVEMKKEQIKSQNLEKWITAGVQVGLTIGGWIAYDIWNKRGLKFEEFGTINSPWTRNLIAKMFPKK